MGCSSSKSVRLSLNDEDVKFLTNNTKYTEEEIKTWYEGFLRDCPDGRLTKEKFIDIYIMFFPNGNAKEFCEHVYRTFDSDQDGYIDFKEFLLAVGVTTGNNINEKLKWAFKMYDINNDGFIDVSEMTKIIKSLYEMLGKTASNEQVKKVQFIFNEMDMNQDGTVSLNEFLEVCTQDEQLARLLYEGNGLQSEVSSEN